jgi:hypothetical protein
MGEKLQKVNITSVNYAIFFELLAGNIILCRYSVYDSEGNLLAEKPSDPVEVAKRRKISEKFQMHTTSSEHWFKKLRTMRKGLTSSQLVCSTWRNIYLSWGLLFQLQGKKNMRLFLAVAFHQKLVSYHQLTSVLRGDARE